MDERSWGWTGFGFARISKDEQARAPWIYLSHHWSRSNVWLKRETIYNLDPKK